MSLAKGTIAAASLCLALGVTNAWADEVEPVDGPTSAQQRQPQKTLEEITITGSLVPRTQLDGVQSVDVIDRFEIEALGVQNSIDLIERLTYNSGSQSRSDAFRFGGGYGSAQVNLRGLGLGTTLVLVDGRRQTIAGTIATDGSTFVDVNSIPLAMVERVEVLKEGAAATYGSDAVAGVVNFITRKDVQGFEVGTRYQRSRSGQVEQSLSGVFGWTSPDERTHFQFHTEYFDTNQLNSTERSYTQSRRDANGFVFDSARAPGQPAGVNTGISLLGGPGAYFVPFTDPFGNPQGAADVIAAAGGDPTASLFAGAPSAGAVATAVGTSQAIAGGARIPVMDPGCVATGGSPLLQVAGGVGEGFCAIEFVDNFNLFEHEQRAKYNFQARHDFSELLTATFKFDYSYNKIDDVGNSPSFPPLTPFVIPVNNPGNFTGLTLVQNASGRPLGDSQRTERAFYYTRNLRYEGGLKGDFGDSGFAWDLNIGFNQEKRHADAPDTFAIEYQNSLFGLGGSQCPLLSVAGIDATNVAAMAAAAGVTPGVGPCRFFNPTGSAITNPGGVGIGGLTLGNDLDTIRAFTGRLETDTTTSLLYVDGLITGELMELPAGPVGFAFGYQYRRNTFEVDRDANQTVDANGINQVTGLPDSRYLFLGGGSEVDVEQTNASVFTEIVIPATQALELQAALRYEDYNGGIGSSVDPKLGFRYDANDWLTLRGSFSTTFRAPSLNQQAARATAVQSLSSSQGTDTGFKAVDNAGNPDLKPEEADVYNFGAIVRPFDGLNLTLDYFRIDFEDIISSQVPQNLINQEETLGDNAAIIANALANPTAGLFCNDPNFQRLMQGGRAVITRNNGADVAAPTCNVARVEAQFINNSSLVTDGIDLALTWDLNVAGLDSFRFFSNVTHLIQFDINNGDGTVKAAASLNETTFVSSLPKWRVNTGFQGSLGSHSAGITFRYISGYEDDRPLNGGAVGRNIGDHNEVDLYYAYDLQKYNATVQVGVFNLLDNEPPFVALDFGFDTRVVDPRGRRFYSNLIWRF